MPIAKRMAVISQQQPFTIESVFSRVGVAYDKYENQVQANTPRFGMAGVDEPGLLIEEGTTNILPASESQELTEAYITGTLDGTYTFSCRSGSILLSGGASGTVTPTNPITATISSATVTLTPADTATYNQIENKSYSTSWTLGGTTRAAECLTVPANILNIGDNTEITIEFEYYVTGYETADHGNTMFFHRANGWKNYIYIFYNGWEEGFALRTTDDSNNTTTTPPIVLTKGFHKFSARLSESRISLIIDDHEEYMDNPYLPEVIGTLNIGGIDGSQTSNSLMNNLKIRKISADPSPPEIDKNTTLFMPLKEDLSAKGACRI